MGTCALKLTGGLRGGLRGFTDGGGLDDPGDLGHRTVCGLGRTSVQKSLRKVKVGLVAVGEKQGPVRVGGDLLGSWVWFGTKIP